jgi:hypothetical protein
MMKHAVTLCDVISISTDFVPFLYLVVLHFVSRDTCFIMSVKTVDFIKSVIELS